ncbi:MAG TPA: helix-turn-helix transcriptional regulator [Leptolyngbyaceae cyanobacterium M33_DOE_097]|uniref:AraC family transcriptional regulator n=1 Tax=Oscillatoriales cyanobacterium SpSt-418 TaxID=2282169 RepID=A0A7C3KCY8_9CYAN|nr:helix-turn-helix transcriptional regulator [Leptolyngbyaceae cyanobacterium M33_DOE_097]
MVNVLPGDVCGHLWQISRQQAQQADPQDAGDRVAICPSILGKGYKRDIELRNGIDLTFHRYQLRDDLVMDRVPAEETGYLEWMFALSSTVRLPGGVQISQGQHLLAGLITPGGNVEGLGYTTTIEVDIHLEPEGLKTLVGDQIDVLPTELQRMLERDESTPFSPVRSITPAMQVALQQMLDCPYQGVIKQMYLESKSVEVLALWLDQVHADDALSQPSPTLAVVDIDRIHQAREILLNQLDHPPSLLTLARQVGLNDCTLKRGFKQVFGITVFGYLHQCRMEQARSLLLENQHSVTAIAQTVGYTNLSAFSSAFRKRYGVSPRAMQGGKVGA